MANKKSNPKEDFKDVYRPLLTETPYRYVSYDRSNGKTPLYLVGGVIGGPWKAENALRKAFHAKGGNCFYCKQPLQKSGATIDHVQGRKGAAAGAVQNLVLACQRCNTAKADKPIEVFAPASGRNWLVAALRQIEDRLNKLDQASPSPPMAEPPTPTAPD